ncbi:hypothetical protein BDV10DRAFT_164794 [Aspergillus recurvatus]
MASGKLDTIGLQPRDRPEPRDCVSLPLVLTLAGVICASTITTNGKDRCGLRANSTLRRHYFRYTCGISLRATETAGKDPRTTQGSERSTRELGYRESGTSTQTI